ncbi:MAG: condensation domain-containing protein [Blastocatellia bacterium]
MAAEKIQRQNTLPNATAASDRAAEDRREAASELKKYLKQRLPDYMVPGAIVFVDSFPITPNGKIDRLALSAFEPILLETDRSFVTPRNPVEQIVAGVFAETLKLEKVGAEDDFFEIGGHSLLATQVISRIRDAFQVELPLRCLFETPTVSGLASSIESAINAGNSLQSPPIVRIDRNEELPLSFAQQRIWFVDQMSPGATYYNIPAAVRVEGNLDHAALEASLNEVVKRHEALRTTFVSFEGRPAQVISQSLELQLPVIDLSHLTGQEREQETNRLVTILAGRPFQLEQGPLLRAMLVRLSETAQVFVIIMHHIVSDGWSIGILIREIKAYYEALCKRDRFSLPELRIQYADVAHWQRQYLTGEVLEQHLQYWRSQLSGMSELKLPTDYPRPDVQTFDGDFRYFELTEDLTYKLTALSHREGVTLFMMLLAAFQTLLHRYTGQDDIVVGADVANRNRTEFEPLIGFFVNMLVMRAFFSGTQTFRELLAQVRETALGAYAHQDLPLEKLVAQLQPDRNLSRSPLFQVVFVLHNTPREQIELPELTLTPIEVSTSTVQYDLILSVNESGKRLTGSLAYNTSLFKEKTIDKMIRHFQSLLEAIAINAGERISNLRLLDEAETAGLTSLDFPDAELSQEEFEQLVLELNRVSEAG